VWRGGLGGAYLVRVNKPKGNDRRKVTRRPFQKPTGPEAPRRPYGTRAKGHPIFLGRASADAQNRFATVYSQKPTAFHKSAHQSLRSFRCASLPRPRKKEAGPGLPPGGVVLKKSSTYCCAGESAHPVSVLARLCGLADLLTLSPSPGAPASK
jgi:hypothetical protein